MADRVLPSRYMQVERNDDHPLAWFTPDGKGWVPVDGADSFAIDYESLAAAEHSQWAHWTAYMLDNLSRENIIRWSLQIETPYAELTEAEKESDREWARKAVVAVLVVTDDDEDPADDYLGGPGHEYDGDNV